MPDRRSAPIFAAAAAFVLVLAFGKLFSPSTPSSNPGPSGSVTATPTATPSSSPTATPKATSTVGQGRVGTIPTPTPSAEVQLTVIASGPLDESGLGASDQSIPVEALQEGANTVPMAGTLSLNLGPNGPIWNGTLSLSAGTYQVCLQPPSNLQPVGKTTDPQVAQQGFFCKQIRLELAPQTVSFKLRIG